MNNRADRKEKGMSKDFILVVIGQIISLFGNAVLRFALPLHLLNVTDSPAMYGALFEKLAGSEWIIFAIALAAIGIVTWKFYQWTEVYRESESFVSYPHR